MVIVGVAELADGEDFVGEVVAVDGVKLFFHVDLGGVVFAVDVVLVEVGFPAEGHWFVVVVNEGIVAVHHRQAAVVVAQSRHVPLDVFAASGGRGGLAAVAVGVAAAGDVAVDVSHQGLLLLLLLLVGGGSALPHHLCWCGGLGEGSGNGGKAQREEQRGNGAVFYRCYARNASPSRVGMGSAGYAA